VHIIIRHQVHNLLHWLWLWANEIGELMPDEIFAVSALTLLVTLQDHRHHLQISNAPIAV